MQLLIVSAIQDTLVLRLPVRLVRRVPTRTLPARIRAQRAHVAITALRDLLNQFSALRVVMVRTWDLVPQSALVLVQRVTIALLEARVRRRLGVRQTRSLCLDLLPSAIAIAPLERRSLLTVLAISVLREPMLRRDQLFARLAHPDALAQPLVLRQASAQAPAPKAISALKVPRRPLSSPVLITRQAFLGRSLSLTVSATLDTPALRPLAQFARREPSSLRLVRRIVLLAPMGWLPRPVQQTALNASNAHTDMRRSTAYALISTNVLVIIMVV